MQTDLFLGKDVSFEEIVKELNVSVASIRNWVASGELDLATKGHVTAQSYDSFKLNSVGKSRLVKRANKTFFDDTDVIKLKSQVERKIKASDAPLSDLASEYENDLGKAYRNQEGIYYTPEHIVDKIFKSVKGDVSHLTFLDPCCGSGNFLIGALKRGFKPENIYGVDCDGTALKLAKARMENVTSTNFKNLDTCVDFLEVAMSEEKLFNQKFDVIITNPPWGKKYSKVEKARFAKAFNKGVSVDSSAFFSLAALRFSKLGAQIGMLLPDTFCNITSFQSFRSTLLDLKILKIEDFDKPFKGLMVGAVSILFENSKASSSNKISCVSKKHVGRVRQSSFANNPNQIFNFDISQAEADLIDHLFDKGESLLKQNVKWGMGIVTGNNAKHCSDVPSKNNEAVFKGADILSVDKIKEPSKFISTDFDDFQQVAPKEMYRAEDKLIYKFISDKLCFFHDTQQRLILNSANMLVLEKDFPLDSKQLAFLLNSKIMNFIFRSVFRTYKVLRSDLESLPIFSGYFKIETDPDESKLLAFLGVEESDGAYRIKSQID